jgi:hypothetical protein
MRDESEYRRYMRIYMAARRQRETPAQHEERLKRQRDYYRKQYDESLARCGLERVGSGNYRDWDF